MRAKPEGVKEPAIKMQSKVATLSDMAMAALHNQLTEAAKKDISRLSTIMDEQIKAVDEETFSQYQKNYLA